MGYGQVPTYTIEGMKSFLRLEEKRRVVDVGMKE
jgi:hypothetical protein